MFKKHQQHEVDTYMKSHAEFRRLYRHHQKLDSKVRDAELGVLPMDGVTLRNMKREKLHAKGRLLQMWDDRQAVH